MLTKTTIDSAPPRGKPFLIWDDELHGFGCIIHPTGRRSFVVQYRLRGASRTHRVALGAYGDVTLAQARKRAADMLAEARLGHDPKAEAKARKAEAGELTLAALVQHYLTAIEENRVPSRRLKGRQRSKRYAQGIKFHLDGFAAIHGKLAANAITRAHVRLYLDKLTHQPASHRIAHGTLHRMFDWAIKRDLISCADPTANIESHNPPSRERSLSLDEVGHLWRASEALASARRDAFRLLLLTGQRRGEVAGMQWGEIDLDRALWTLPTERTKARRQHVVPLPGLALAILRERRAAFRRDPAPDDLVFPTLARDGRLVPLSCWQAITTALDAKVKLPGWRLHDLRRTFVTLCAEHGADIAVLDTILNHAASVTRAGVIGIYQRATLLEPARAVMRQWDGLLRGGLGLPAPPAPEVVVLREAA